MADQYICVGYRLAKQWI